MSHIHTMREPPRHTTKSVKLMAIVHRLQQIMINENLTPDELVGCAEIVRSNYGRIAGFSTPKQTECRPVNAPFAVPNPAPPPRRP